MSVFTGKKAPPVLPRSSYLHLAYTNPIHFCPSDIQRPWDRKSGYALYYVNHYLSLASGNKQQQTLLALKVSGYRLLRKNFAE